MYASNRRSCGVFEISKLGSMRRVEPNRPLRINFSAWSSHPGRFHLLRAYFVGGVGEPKVKGNLRSPRLYRYERLCWPRNIQMIDFWHCWSRHSADFALLRIVIPYSSPGLMNAAYIWRLIKQGKFRKCEPTAFRPFTIFSAFSIRFVAWAFALMPWWSISTPR